MERIAAICRELDSKGLDAESESIADRLECEGIRLSHPPDPQGRGTDQARAAEAADAIVREIRGHIAERNMAVGLHPLADRRQHGRRAYTYVDTGRSGVSSFVREGLP